MSRASRLLCVESCSERSDAQVIGTPEEDALRRDLTINALFYNVHTRLVEDWTGKVRHALRACD